MHCPISWTSCHVGSIMHTSSKQYLCTGIYCKPQNFHIFIPRVFFENYNVSSLFLGSTISHHGSPFYLQVILPFHCKYCCTKTKEILFPTIGSQMGSSDSTGHGTPWGTDKYSWKNTDGCWCSITTGKARFLFLAYMPSEKTCEVAITIVVTL
jgi:hypothetical protein